MNIFHKNKLLIIITIAILFIGLLLWKNTESKQMENPNRIHPPMQITQNQRPFCIGRMVIDLPEVLYLDNKHLFPHIANELELNLVRISTRRDVSLEEFNTIVQARWAEVQTYTHTPNKKPYVKPSVLNQINEHAWILAFNHTEIESNVRWVNDENVYDLKIYYDAEGYFWDNGTLFTFKDSGTNIVEEIADLIKNSRYHEASQIPQEAGICLNGGFIKNHYRTATEFFRWRLELPDSGLFLNVVNDSDVKEMTLLEKRNRQGGIKASGSGEENGSFIAYTTYRAAHREDYLPADEWITVASEYDVDVTPREYRTEVSGNWEFTGSKAPNPKPSVVVNMGFNYKTADKPNTLGAYPSPSSPKTYPTEEEFMALWDAIVSTIRFSEHALTPKPKQEEATPPIARNEAQVQRDKKLLDDFLGNG